MGRQSHWTHEFAEGKSFNIPYHPRNSQLDIAPKNEQQGQALAAALKKELDELFLEARSAGFSYKEAAQLIAERGFVLSRFDTQRFWEQGQARKSLDPSQLFTLRPDTTDEFDPLVDQTRDHTVDSPASEFGSDYEDTEAVVSHYPREGASSSLEIARATAEFYGRGRLPTKLPPQDQFLPPRRLRYLERDYRERIKKNLPKLRETVAGMPDGPERAGAEAFISEMEGEGRVRGDNNAALLQRARSKLDKRYKGKARIAWWAGDRLLDYARALMIRGGGDKARPDAIDPLLLEGFEDRGLIQAIESPQRQLEASFDRQASAFLYFDRVKHEAAGGRFGAVGTGGEEVPGPVSPTLVIPAQVEPTGESGADTPPVDFSTVALFNEIEPEVAELARQRAGDLIKYNPSKDAEGMVGGWSQLLNKLFRKRFGQGRLGAVGPLEYLKIIDLVGQHFDVDAREFILTSIPQHQQIEVRGGRPSTGFDELQQGGRTSIVMERMEYIKSGRGLTKKSYEELLKDNSIVKIHGRRTGKKKSEFLMRVAGVDEVRQGDLQGLSERTNESLETLQARFLSAQSVGEPLIEVRLKPFEQDIGTALAEVIAPGSSSWLVDEGEDIGDPPRQETRDDLDLEQRISSPVEDAPPVGDASSQLTPEQEAHNQKELDFYENFHVDEGGYLGLESLGDPFKDDPLPGYKHYNIHAGGHSVGKVILRKTEDKFNLLHLEISPEWRGRGLGFKWMGKVIDELWAKGIEPVFELAHNQNVIKWAKEKGGVFSGHKRVEGPEGKMESTVESIRFPLPGKGKSKK